MVMINAEPVCIKSACSCQEQRVADLLIIAPLRSHECNKPSEVMLDDVHAVHSRIHQRVEVCLWYVTAEHIT